MTKAEQRTERRVQLSDLVFNAIRDAQGHKGGDASFKQAINLTNKVIAAYKNK